LAKEAVSSRIVLCAETPHQHILREGAHTVCKREHVEPLLVRGACGGLYAAIGEEAAECNVFDAAREQLLFELAARKAVETPLAKDDHIIVLGRHLLIELCSKRASDEHDGSCCISELAEASLWVVGHVRAEIDTDVEHLDALGARSFAGPCRILDDLRTLDLNLEQFGIGDFGV